MTRRLPLLLLLSGLSLCAVPRPAHAEPPLPATELNAEARKQYKQGSDALAAQRYVEAALHFETATSKNPHAVSWYMAATAWEKASRLERAADALARALDVPGLSPELGEKIKNQLRNLEGSLGTVLVGGAPSYRASLDGGTAVAPPARLHGLPGTHVITIIPPDHAPYRRELMLTTGTTSTVLLGEGDEENAPAPTPVAVEVPKPVIRYVTREVPRPAETRRYVGFGVTGLGVASLAASALLGASTLDGRDAYRSARTQDAYDHVRMLQTWTNVTLVAGAVLVAGGVALILWPANRRPGSSAYPIASLDVAPAANGILVRGSF